MNWQIPCIRWLKWLFDTHITRHLSLTILIHCDEVIQIRQLSLVVLLNRTILVDPWKTNQLLLMNRFFITRHAEGPNTRNKHVNVYGEQYDTLIRIQKSRVIHHSQSSLESSIVFSGFLNNAQWTKSKNPVIPSITHYWQEPLESTCGVRSIPDAGTDITPTRCFAAIIIILFSAYFPYFEKLT
jgi:hypothetical protein